MINLELEASEALAYERMRLPMRKRSMSRLRSLLSNRRMRRLVGPMLCWTLLLWAVSGELRAQVEGSEAPDATMEEEDAPEEELLSSDWTEADAQRLDAIREELKALESIQRVLAWYAVTQGEPEMEAETYHGHDALLSVETLALLDRALERTGLDPEETRALQLLRADIARQYIRMRVAPFDDRLQKTEREVSVRLSFLNEPVSYVRLKRLAQKERGARGEEVQQALSQFQTGVLLPLLRERELLRRSLAIELGFVSAQALAEDVREASLGELLLQSARFLEQSDGLQALLREELERELRGLQRESEGKGFSELLQGPPERLDRHYPAELELKRVKGWLKQLGLPARGVSGAPFRWVKLHGGAQGRAAFSFLPRGPADVRIAYVPEGGFSALEQLLEVTGQALYGANVRAPQYEFQYLGSGAQRWAAGELFRQLLTDPDVLKQEPLREGAVWQRWRMRLSKRERAWLVRWGVWRELTALRLEAFAFLGVEAQRLGLEVPTVQPPVGLVSGLGVERDDARLQLGRAQALYQRAAGFEVSAELPLSVLLEQPELLQGMDRVRGKLLSYAMLESLRAQLGEEWVRDAQSGRWLLERWQGGTALDWKVLSQELGQPPTFETALSRFERLLKEADTGVKR